MVTSLCKFDSRPICKVTQFNLPRSSSNIMGWLHILKKQTDKNLCKYICGRWLRMEQTYFIVCASLNPLTWPSFLNLFLLSTRWSGIKPFGVFTIVSRVHILIVSFLLEVRKKLHITLGNIQLFFLIFFLVFFMVVVIIWKWFLIPISKISKHLVNKIIGCVLLDSYVRRVRRVNVWWCFGADQPTWLLLCV